MQDDEFVIDKEAEENRVRQTEADEDLVEVEERVDAKAKKTRDELLEARAEAKANLDGWQRAKADYVNLLKGIETDVKNAKEAGVTKAVGELLPAYDAIERAKDLPAQAGHEAMVEGFQAIVKQLEAGFASLGLVAVGEVG